MLIDPLRRTSVLSLCALGTLLVSGCNIEIIIPESDQTPPEVKLFLLNFDRAGDVKEITSNTTLEVAAGTNLTVVAKADDPEGVRELTLWAAGHHRCESGDVGLVVPVDYTKSFVADPELSAGDEASSLALTGVSVDGDSFHRCPLRRDGTPNKDMQFYATAGNFYAGTARTPTLSLVTPQ